MNLIKKSKYLVILLLALVFSGCIHNLNNQGLVISLSEEELSDSFKSSFPQKKDFVFGTIVIEEPIITMPENSQRITASINLDFQTMFTQEIVGDFIISGEPLFNKESASIFLQNVKIENLKFSKLKLGDAFSKTFLSSLSPMVNKVFEQYPIYTIPKDTFQGRFVKNVKIEDSKLLITYGI